MQGSITHLISDCYAIEVPEGSIKHIVDMGYLIFKVPNYANWVTDEILSDYGKLTTYLKTHNAEKDYKTGGIPLLTGNWQIIATTKEMNNEQSDEIVECMSVATGGDDYHNYYRNYLLPDSPEVWPWFDECEHGAIKSFQSLLASKGLTGNYVILKKTS